MATKNGATTKATKSDLATKDQLATERKRATALAAQYKGQAEIRPLREVQAEYDGVTDAIWSDPARFDLRFRKCSICGRFPARALVHLALHENGTLDAKGHRTDAKARKAIAERVAKALKTIAASKPKAKAKMAKEA